MYSQEGLLDLKTEKYVVSVFYLGRAQPPLWLLLFWSVCPQGTNSSCPAWDPSISCLRGTPPAPRFVVCLGDWG